MLTRKENFKNEKKNNPKSKEAHPPQQALAKAPTQQLIKTPSPSTQQPERTALKTRLTIKYDVGYPNQFYIRGQGANLSWDQGQLLKNVKPDEWVWETDVPFTQCEFKVLINDQLYECGDNHLLHPGAVLLYTPHFTHE
jgi:hypothetical protein